MFIRKKDSMFVKQEVMVGDTNANDAVITAGLQENEHV